MDRIICIVGPTASGKTRLSVALAQALDGEVVSFDSMQVYRGMTVGTAAPTAEEMAGVPHHMIGVIDPRESFSVSRYCEMADPIVQDILHRGRTVILVGGTGLYVDSLIAGREFAPQPADGQRAALERQADALGMEAMLDRLRTVDPETAAALHPSNRKRVLRALEVYERTGVPISEHNRRTQSLPPKYAPLWLGTDYADRSLLWQRIAARADAMLAGGLREELAALTALGLSRDSTALQAIGYKELLDDPTTAREKIIFRSRQYAKRQRTWFRRNPSTHWIYADNKAFEEIFSDARQLIPFFDNAER